jgi:hypothetical protein
MSNFIKKAYFTGVQDALVNFGLAKHAAPAPIYDNPYEDAPAPAAPAPAPKSSKSLSDMSDSDIDAMVSKIPASKGSADDIDSLLAGLPPRGAKPPREEMVFTMDDYNLGDSPAPKKKSPSPKKKSPSQGGGKVTYVNIPEYPEDVITAKKPLVAASGAGAGPKPLTTRRGGQSSMPAKSPSKGGGKVTYVNIPEYPEDVITAKKPPANRQAFPGSDPTALVNLMSNPMTRPNLSRQL